MNFLGGRGLANISNLIIGVVILYPDLSFANKLSYKMVACLYVPCSVVINMILCYCNCWLIITIVGDGLHLSLLHIVQDSSYPNSLTGSYSNDHVFSLRRWQSNRCLFFRAPWHNPYTVTTMYFFDWQPLSVAYLDVALIWPKDLLFAKYLVCYLWDITNFQSNFDKTELQFFLTHHLGRTSDWCTWEN